jgi:hypothetical protein
MIGKKLVLSEVLPAHPDHVHRYGPGSGGGKGVRQVPLFSEHRGTTGGQPVDHHVSCPENPPHADGVVRAELVALETGAAEMAVIRVHTPVLFHEYSHRAHVNADKALSAAVRVDIYFKLDGCRQADFHGRSRCSGRQAAAAREAARGAAGKAWLG